MSYSALEMAEAFLRGGELPEALAALNEHITLAAADVAARRLRAQVLARLDQPQAALTDLAAATDLTEDDLCLKVRLLNALDDPDTARQLLQNWSPTGALSPRLTDLLYHQLMLLEHWQAARELAEQQTGWRWQMLAGDACYADGDYAGALAACEAALTSLHTRYATSQAEPSVIQWTAQAELAAARCQLHLSQWSAAQTRLRWVTQHLDDPSAHFLLAYSHYQQHAAEADRQAMRAAWLRCSPVVRQQVCAGLVMPEGWLEASLGGHQPSK